VLPAGDPEVLALSERRRSLGPAFCYPPHPVVLRAFDKLELAEAGRRAGFAVPPTGEPGVLTPPLVVKPRLRAGKPIAPVLARDAAEAERERAALRRAGLDAVVQAYVDGALAAYVVLAAEGGEVLAESFQVAEEVWPARAGGSVRAETVAPSEELRGGVAALLVELGWTGLAQIQFLLPRGGGQPVLLDLNGRLYGSLALAVRAGVNFPYLWARLATGQSVPRGLRARPGVRYHALEGDLRRISRRLGAYPGAARYAWGAAGSVSDRADPRPALFYATWGLTRMGGRLRRRLSGR
jgi:predicted ATP-grasp superfamily ATP-dependent carboligase